MLHLILSAPRHVCLISDVLVSTFYQLKVAVSPYVNFILNIVLAGRVPWEQVISMFIVLLLPEPELGQPESLSVLAVNFILNTVLAGRVPWGQVISMFIGFVTSRI